MARARAALGQEEGQLQDVEAHLRGRGPLQTKWHHVSLKRARWQLRPKARLPRVRSPSHPQLVMTADQIELGEEARPCAPRVPSSSVSMCSSGSIAGRVMALRPR